MANLFQSGRHCKVSVMDGTNELTVDLIGAWTLNMTAEAIKAPVFGDVWTKTAATGLASWNGTFTGFLASASEAQDILEQAFINGTDLDDIKFYLNDTEYYAPNVAEDPDYAYCKITGFSPKAAANTVVTLDITFEGSGPIARF